MSKPKLSSLPKSGRDGPVEPVDDTKKDELIKVPVGVDPIPFLNDDNDDDDDDDLGDKPLGLPDDDDEPDDKPQDEFLGFDSGVGSEVEGLKREIAQLRQQVGGLNADPELPSMTPEEFQELANKDPQKAMEIGIRAVMADTGMLTSPEEIIQSVRSTTDKERSVEENRLRITEEFNPTENKKLVARATEIYLERKKRGLSVENDPDAEYIAFTQAAREIPVKNASRNKRGDSRRNRDAQSGGTRNRRSPSSEINSKTREIGTAMGVNLADPAVAARISALTKYYDKRRVDQPRRKK